MTMPSLNRNSQQRFVSCTSSFLHCAITSAIGNVMVGNSHGGKDQMVAKEDDGLSPGICGTAALCSHTECLPINIIGTTPASKNRGTSNLDAKG